MFASIAEGHADLADLLFLIAFIVFTLAALSMLVVVTVSSRIQSFLIPAGLALVALAFFVS